MIGPCAKQTVRCIIYPNPARGPDRYIVVGTNACANPQEKCPRLPGEGYEKCKSICQQMGHAEVQAIAQAKAAGVDLEGAHAVIEGHTYACMECQHALTAAGVRTFTISKLQR